MNLLDDIMSRLSSTETDSIEKALDDLGDLNPENALELILPFLSHDSDEVRETAVANLGDIDDARAIPYIIDRAKNDVESVKKHAYKALENYRSTEIFTVLTDEIKKTKRSGGPRQVIAGQLKDYPSEEAREILAYLILDDDDPHVFIPAVDSLYSMNAATLLKNWKEIDDVFHHEYVNSIAKKAISEIEKLDKKGK